MTPGLSRVWRGPARDRAARRLPRQGRQRASPAGGYSLVELLVVVALVGVTVVAGLPGIGAARQHAALAATAAHVNSAFRAARSEAVRRGVSVAVEFLGSAAAPSYRFVADGNGNGVRRADIDAGVDIPIAPAWVAAEHVAGVGFVVGCRCTDIDGVAPLTPGETGVRFGASGLAVFSPAGTASSGTLYLSAGAEATYAIRVLGVSGRIRTLRFDPAGGDWVAP